MKKYAEERMPISEAQNLNLSAAIAFAAERHAGQCRKGTDLPYIVHPMEVLLILADMGAGAELMMAGVLHDTIEDTGTTRAEIEERFGKRVADWVAAHSENKALTWRERKSAAIEELRHADRELAMLIVADKLSNLRSMVKDYAKVGEDLWKRFRAGAKKQAWYYGGIQDAVEWMGNDPVCAPFYWEMVALYKDLFVRYYWDEDRLYQICRDGTGYQLRRCDPNWVEWTRVPDEAIEISRSDAEAMEEEWNAEFWARHSMDMEDAQYWLYQDEENAESLTLRDHSIAVVCTREKEGHVCRKFGYLLDETAAENVMLRLRIHTMSDAPLSDLLVQSFGGMGAARFFLKFCQSCGVDPEIRELW